MSLSVEELRESRMRSVVAYAEFVDSTGKLPNHLFCFFEGKDNPYYVPRIKKYTDDFHPIKCGGRSKVLEVHNLIKNQVVYNNYKKAFFVDRDFNEELPVQKPIIYETPCYSIENLFVDFKVFKQILSNEFHLSETTNALHEKYLKLYQERQQEFHNVTLLFNAWYACLITIRNEQNIQTGVQLEDKFPKGLIQISIDKILQNYTFQDLLDKFPNAPEVEEEILSLKILEFENCDALRTFRGKFEMDFLLKFIDYMLADSKTNGQPIKFSFGTQLNNQQAIALFSTYAETPDCLNVYINKVIN
ncbi:DUF4435 domain-containing protein [Flavobacterium ginsenosidimutans]|uniref:DUF4435 domain-containing protein n=1 Tax=Flavobacterium ginsenosidimutans TaxID=687844 RepID=UPI000DAB48D0|nr:DUF4435 domain-containing protein [Flavobacterium ginsenosidimutans]KAF2331743.1 DUF4435 domain-containing protein [Flavobacterium ginsenosidimutans]